MVYLAAVAALVEEATVAGVFSVSVEEERGEVAGAGVAGAGVA